MHHALASACNSRLIQHEELLASLQTSVELKWQQQQQAADEEKADGEGGQKRKAKKPKAEPKSKKAAAKAAEPGMAPEVGLNSTVELSHVQ